MQTYEITYIVDAAIADDKREKIVSQVKTLIEQAGGEPGELEFWGKRDFSYILKRKLQGVYYLQYAQFEPTSVASFEGKLKINTDIMRYLIVKQQKRKIKRKTTMQRKGARSQETKVTAS